ncbi:SacI homology domain-containing protein [Baffinella frigidus]|nr:SacI homology domain-containing protein [Cryptophyta sp. CCMP2293]
MMSAPPAHVTRVAVATTPSGELVLVATLATKKQTQLISVDASSGELVHRGIVGHDVFASEAEAMEALRARFCGGKSIPAIVHGHAFLGMVHTSTQVQVLVASEVRRDPLPGGHSMCTVGRTQWVSAPLPSAAGRPPLSKTDGEGLERLKDFTVSGFHFYSETYDLTRPYPSPRPVLGYDPNYCWNEWLASPFEKAGLRACCVVLLQGLACSKVLRVGQRGVAVALISRKNISNPGTRYNARGLNDVAGAGNEMESEQIVWGATLAGGVPVEKWSATMWRRGTVPVHWRHELQSSVTAPKIVIADRPFEQGARFFAAIHERYGGRPMVFVNLLRCDTESGETGLSEVFQGALRDGKKKLREERGMEMELSMCNFDWHRLRKELGMPLAVRGLWDRLQSMITESDLTEGTIAVCEPGGEPTPMAAPYLKLKRRQGKILRYNCADSLDRTNLCCFMVSQQVLLEQCRRLGSGLMDAVIREHLPGGGDTSSASWGFLLAPDLTIEDLRAIINPKVLEWLAEMYVRNGDVMSMLYTSTPALMTNVMREYTTLPPQASDTQLTVQRRYQNVLNDAEKQLCFFTFLGRFLRSLLPGAANAGSLPRCVSSPGAYAVTLLPSMTSPADTDCQILDAKGPWAFWLCPPDHDVVDLCLLLREPVVVTDVQIWVKNGLANGSAAFPRGMSVWAGPYYNSLTKIYGDVPLPLSDDGVCLTFPIPSTLAAEEGPDGTWIPSLAPPPPDATPAVSRVVHIQFTRDPASPRAMILGRVQVNGVPPDVVIVPDSGVNAMADATGLAALTSPPATDSMVERKVRFHLGT